MPSDSLKIEKKRKRPFCIAGIGGSAGSLEAFEEFFRNMTIMHGTIRLLSIHAKRISDA